jgi:hypothetical protein
MEIAGRRVPFLSGMNSQARSLMLPSASISTFSRWTMVNSPRGGMYDDSLKMNDSNAK